jgi:hypothetical protein
MARVSMMDQAELDEAFAELLHQIACGREYPDAQWAVADEFKVSADALQEMYDAHCQ